MYDFITQKKMLKASFDLLKEKHIEDISALGGGTALSAFYWGHRFSTDIDIFIYSDEEKKHLLIPNNWSEAVKNNMILIGYNGDFKFQNIYLEFVLDENHKMQFFDVNAFTNAPYEKVSLWTIDLNIESIEEIIAKKIHYRCEVGNARDLFDIALAIHKKPDILTNLGRLKKEKINLLFDTVEKIYNSVDMKAEYLVKINEMNPNEEYKRLSLITIDYLYSYLESYCGAFNLGIKLDSKECIELEKIVYIQVLNNSKS